MIIYPESKFFTNEPERDLYTRFASILNDGTQFFDVIVGYFRSSGFFRLYHSLENVTRIRILIGLNVDNMTLEMAKKDFAELVIKEFDSSDVTYEIEDGAKKFIEWLKTGKLQMRMYPRSRLHAKVYIIQREAGKLDSVITGSSNFSEAGLMNNIEFNVELNHESDIKFALDRFEALWSESISIEKIYVETAEQRTWLRSDITPYEIYLKTLYEFFYQELKDSREIFSENDLPDDYMRLQYQIDAVIQARRMLETYGGVFVSDVVGLGKTYICAMLAKILPRGKKLVICPPVLVDYWAEVMREFNVPAKIESLGKLDKILEGKNDYEYIFIDEAHRFRNALTEGYTRLHEICYGKKVILISATPINNYSSDIASQIYLFQPRRAANIPGVRNLEAFFKRLIDRLRDIDSEEEYARQLQENSREIRNKILRHIMIRRTRSEIAKYYHDDMSRQGLTFPKAGAPEKIIYSFDERLDAIFDETMKAIKNFTYSRYKPLTYLRDSGRFASQITAQNNMGGFMKSLLVKRLESSFYAFRQTLSRFIESYRKFIRMHEGGKIYICKNIDVDEFLESGTNDDELISLIEGSGGSVFETSDFDTQFIFDLTNDLYNLERLQKIWETVKTDPKLEKFCSELQTNKKLSAVKKIIFTESTETAEYLEQNLRRLYDQRVISFSGRSSASLKAQIERSFNPKFFDSGNDPYDVLITTDILSEGVNLHRANIIINYDLPWNPTRIMQRVGRVNRVGTQHENIYVFNFFPTAQSAKHMPLEARILQKLQLFNETLGGDYKYLSEKEEVSPKKLFDELSANLEINEDSEGELKYLELIRSVRDNEPKLFERIKILPAMSKTARLSRLVEADSTLTFIRKGALKEFFITNGNDTKQISFTEAISLLECEYGEQAIRLDSDYFTQYKANSSAFDEFLITDDIITGTQSKFTGSDKKFFDLIKAMHHNKNFSPDQRNKINRLIRAFTLGTIPPNIIRQIIKTLPNIKDLHEAYSLIELAIPEQYLLTLREIAAGHEGYKHVILSCYMKKGS